ncbi:N-acetylglutaminylglutamine amidotransferase [Phytoactinopolyspora alkaliphila]|uniref:asparagine synthase (glutamine-hydrolyzing) n=1 Tax=Phytoactinopolyspora alkaliphila TaxID=1783498 RepID=A0A6N9YTJ9_9ACTN|nr:N-acetylglutaminylglutamine amidotransferase [Phytoactinopolyspora alkaliphila]NED98260.1 N-acetylglutaminylglutamine amidotransferase [Phytoactinopolyspora alkaliphila]
MCGLSGEYTFDGRPADLAAVANMCEAMVSRGPDDYGAYAHGSLALGHRRLSIIDLSPHGHQPMVDSDLGLTTAFNGCIYNYQELREELRRAGYTFFSTSDTEVIAKAYHHWGEDCVDRFLGMFAFAIHERDSGRLILARDRLGIKPLYYSESNERIRFASSLPALVRGGDVDTSIDPVALHHYLSWHAVVPAPYTILKGIRKLPPATMRVIERDGTSRERLYWDLTAARDPEKASWTDSDWEEAVLESLRVSVRRRLVADVPVGVLLSGGLDSSLVVGLLAQEGQTGLNTFSIGFDAVGGEEGDEFKYSDVVAREFATEHHQIRIGTERMLPALEDAIRAMSEPMVSHDAVAFFLLSQEVSKHVKVVQSGQGADEVFAGYHWYPPLAGAGRDDAVATYAQAFFDRSHEEMRGVVRPEHLVDSPVSLDFVTDHMKRPGAETAVDAALRLDTQIMLVDDPVKRVDNMTMAWGLEARVPFLDHELVELAAQCPPELKLAQEGKGVLKEAGRRVVPHEVIDRPKGYFPVPALKYLRGPYLERVRDALHSPAARSRGLFQPAYVDHLLADPNAELTPLRGNRLWQLALLEMWLQTHLPDAGNTP